MPITLYPASYISTAALEPTLPKPCTMTRLPSRDKPSFLQASSQTIITPRPVASRRPREPPMLMGFPVTTAVTVSHVHGICVHHPGHDLFVGIDVGSRNVFLGADEFDQFGGVASRHAF